MQAKTLGELKATSYQSLSVKDELRKNLIAQLQNKEAGFEGILGYDETVIPEFTVTLPLFHVQVLSAGLAVNEQVAEIVVPQSAKAEPAVRAKATAK